MLVTAVLPLCGLYLIYWACSLWIEYRRECLRLRQLPGFRTWFPVGSGVAGIIIGMFGHGKHHGRMIQFINKRKMYELSKCDVHSAVSILPSVTTRYYISDPQVIKQIGAERALFFKPVVQYKSLLFFGPNIVASEGVVWKKYRKVSAPAFSARNNRLVWEESIHLMQDMFQAKPDWRDRDLVDIDNPLSFTTPLALSVISAAGFGQPMRFSTQGVRSARHSMTFPEALQIVSKQIFIPLIVPSWVPNLTNGLKRVRTAFSELRSYMEEMIQERRTCGQEEERFDLFSGLLDADERDSDVSLHDEEIIGNLFIFLIAGHETTAHTLGYTFGLLALFPDEQERLFRQVKEVCGNGQAPSYNDMSRLTLSLAVFYETLRMFPSVIAIPKKVAEDTIVVTTTAEGETRTIPLPQGSSISIHPPGLHYNSRYWKSPFKFDPSRFLDPNWPKDAFIPFSVGHRSCIGKPFAETEAVAIITMMTLHYKVELQESFLQSTKSLTHEERFEKLFHSRSLLTLTPTHIPLRFSRRQETQLID